MTSRRVLSISLKDLAIDSLERFLERVSEGIKTQHSRVWIEGDKIIVELVGDGTSIRESIVRVKRIVREYKVTPAGKGLIAISIGRLHREAGYAVPPDLLEEILRVMGYTAFYRQDRGVIETNLGPDKVAEVARRLSQLLVEVSATPLTTSARKAVAGASLISGAPPDKIISLGLDSGVLVEDEKGRLAASRGWRESLKTLLRVIEEGW